MTISQPLVKLLEPNQLNAAAHALSRAFFDDPMYSYVMQDETKRLHRSAPFFRTLLRIGLKQGHVLTTQDASSAAIWLRPDNNTITSWSIIRSGIWLNIT